MPAADFEYAGFWPDRTVMTRTQSLTRSWSLLAAMLVIVGGLCGITTSPASAASNPVGISPGADLLWLSDSDLARELDLYKATGMTMVRVDFDWPSIESTKGNMNWAATDRVVAAANARGLKVLALPAYSPLWASSVAGSTHAGPANPADFAAFLTKAVQRYSSQGVTAWEIWNEPNLTNFWAPKPNAAAYTTLLKSAYRAIKAVDQGATVIAGALSPATDPADGSQISPVTFTKLMYQNGAGGYFDALSVHPYCYPAMPSDTSTASWNTFQRLPLVHDVMSNNGDGAKKLWLTEYGAPTGTGTGAVSEAKQADLMVAGISTAAQWSFTGPLFFYGGRDRGSNLADREQNFGFVHEDFSDKPARAALVNALNGTSPNPVPVAPATPTNVQLVSSASTSAKISWKTTSTDTTGYQIQIRTRSGSWKTLTKVASATAEATVTGLKASTSYTVRVSLYNQAGQSAYSAGLSFKTPKGAAVTATTSSVHLAGSATGMSK